MKIKLINPKLTLGMVIHDALSQFLYFPGVVKSKDQLTNILNRYWSEITGEKGGFVSKTEEIVYKQRAIKMLEAFWNNEHFRTAIPVKMPDFPKIDLGEELVLIGKLDWVEDEGDKRYHIVDFKTGAKDERSDSLQLPIYAILVSNYLKSTNLKASYWYLDRDFGLKSYDLPDLDKTLEDIKKLGNVIKLSRQTSSFKCNSGFESCWACRDYVSVINGEAKLVSIDYSRKTEIYMKKEDVERLDRDDLPF